MTIQDLFSTPIGRSVVGTVLGIAFQLAIVVIAARRLIAAAHATAESDLPGDSYMTRPDNLYGFTPRSWAQMRICIWLSVLAGGATFVLVARFGLGADPAGGFATLAALIATFLSFLLLSRIGRRLEADGGGRSSFGRRL